MTPLGWLRNSAIPVRRCFTPRTANWCYLKKQDGIGVSLLLTAIKRPSFSQAPFGNAMPNKKQKQAMRAENRQRALAAKAAAESAADEFEEGQLRELARQADLRGDPLVLPKLSVKTRKA